MVNRSVTVFLLYLSVVPENICGGETGGVPIIIRNRKD
jgi:hypothetical protein